MSTDLSQTGSGQSLQEGKSGQIAKRISDLERGGYYRNVVSPEDYIAGKNRYDSSNNEDLELTDEGSKDIESQGKGVVALKHWNTKVQNKFNECTESQKQAWVDSFKIVEKGFVKQLNALKDDIAVAEPMLEAVAPYYRDIEKLGMTPKEYLQRLIKFDDDLGFNPAYEIARLIAIHKLSYDDIYNQLDAASRNLEEEESIEKYISPLKREITQLKSSLGYGDSGYENKGKEEEAAKAIIDKVTMFFEQRDSAGREMYPGAFEHIQDILELVQTGETLEDAYNLVVNGETARGKEGSVEVEYDEPQGQGRRAALTPREKEKQLLLNTLNRITR